MLGKEKKDAAKAELLVPSLRELGSPTICIEVNLWNGHGPCKKCLEVIAQNVFRQ